MARLYESNGRRVPQTAVCVPVGRTCATRRTVGGYRGGGSCLLVELPSDARVIYAARMEPFELGLRARSIAEAGFALRRVLDRADWPEMEWTRACARQYAPGEWFLAVVRGGRVFAGCGSP